jgi:hypothetical protein
VHIIAQRIGQNAQMPQLKPFLHQITAWLNPAEEPHVLIAIIGSLLGLIAALWLGY